MYRQMMDLWEEMDLYFLSENSEKVLEINRELLDLKKDHPVIYKITYILSYFKFMFL